MFRARRLAALAVWAAAGFTLCRFRWLIHHPGSACHEQLAGFVVAQISRARSANGCSGSVSSTARRAIVPRPVGGFKPQVKLPWFQQHYIPDGSKRLAGPIRPLPLNKTFTRSLRDGVSPHGRGGLNGRYREVVSQHLEEMQELRDRGEPMTATVFWDFEDMEVPPRYHISHREIMRRVLSWFAGLLDAPITRVEAVEFTRSAETSMESYMSGECDYLRTLRQMGAVVHRCWPRMTDAADAILLDRMRETLDEIANGGPKRIFVILSSDDGYIPMLEAAQSEGITVVRITKECLTNYFPGGADFSVPINTPSWGFMKIDLTDKKKNILRPESEWTLEQGPAKWIPGLVALKPAEQEELDKRRFHYFIDAPKKRPRRTGPQLNDTLIAGLERALKGTAFKQWRMKQKLSDSARDAVRRYIDNTPHMQGNGTTAQLFWNFHDMRLKPMGCSIPEYLGRIIRLLEGYLGTPGTPIPISRVEVSRIVEPWDRPGSHAHDFTRHMRELGMVFHPVWPPHDEATNIPLRRGVALKTHLANTGKSNYTAPKIICVMAEQFIFDQSLQAAQKSGISVLWIGLKGQGLFYPAHSEARVKVELWRWDDAVELLATSARSPFVAGAALPGSFNPEYYLPSYPTDTTWGKISNLTLSAEAPRLQAPVDRPQLTA